MKSPIIFLDFDGVLNSEPFLKHRPHCLDPRAVAILNDLLRRSGAKIVVSSMWRMRGLAQVRKDLANVRCVGEVIDVTPVLSTARGTEIATWLSANEAKVSSFVILDDSDDMEHLLPRLVLTMYEKGLQPWHVERCLKKLQEPWSGAAIWLPPREAVHDG